MGVEKVFDFAWEQVFAAAYHQVFDAANNFAIAFFIDYGQISCVHPACTVYGFTRFRFVFPITQHHRVATCAQFARLSAWHDVAKWVDNFHFHMRMDAANGVHFFVERVVGVGLHRHRRGFGHAVTNRHFAQIHFGDDLFHHFGRTRGARHDACAQV